MFISVGWTVLKNPNKEKTQFLEYLIWSTSCLPAKMLIPLSILRMQNKVRTVGANIILEVNLSDGHFKIRFTFYSCVFYQDNIFIEVWILCIQESMETSNKHDTSTISLLLKENTNVHPTDLLHYHPQQNTLYKLINSSYDLNLRILVNFNSFFNKVCCKKNQSQNFKFSWSWWPISKYALYLFITFANCVSH